MESPSPLLTVQREAVRPLADFPTSIWEDPLTFSISDPACDTYKQKRCALKEKVKEMLTASNANPIENIKFIDVLCRLGVSYHFENEIEEQLEKIFGIHDLNDMIKGDEYDLHTVGLVFQLFRQFGYKISSDVFDKFKTEDGKFKEHLGDNPKGMLSLYEAAQWSTHGEDILDEALAFSKSCLEGLASQSSPNLAVRIKNALKHSYHKGITRIETRQYIFYYEQEELHDNTLLEFAKVDFNFLQLLHREELAHVSRWYKDLEINSKFPYVRSRVVECYLWAIGAYFEPQYSRGRITLATFLMILTVIDDTYDAYGTLEELDLLTEAIDRWHATAIKELPDNMKYLYRIVLEFFDKIEEELEKEGRSGCGFYVKESVKILAKAYHQEAKWLHEDCVPTFQEYKENALISCCYYALIAASFIGMADIAKLEAFEWLCSYPKLLVASQMICRFTDDITSYEFEHERKHVSTGIDCYMKQYGVSKDKAIEVFQSIIMDSWKDMNQELMRPHSFPFPILMRILNLTRVIEVFYKYQDAFTNPEFLKDYIVALFIETIPM